jgi:hypothetical protein
MSTASTHGQPSRLETAADPHGGTSKIQLWTGRVMTTLSILFLLFDALGKFAKPTPVIDAFARLGIPISLCTSIGALLLIFTILYALPRTAVLGAVLLTGYLGGAVAIQMRAGSTTFETVFPVILGVMTWAGIYLRWCGLRRIFPVAR